MSVPVGILTVSDKCSRGQATDTSGPALAQLLMHTPSATQWVIVATAVVPDDKEQISDTVQSWCTPRTSDGEPPCRLVIVAGGTGISPSDVTVGALEPLFTKRLPALATAMVVGSLKITPMAALSQVTAGVVNDTTVVLAVPGSKRGATENVQQILPVLPHAIDTLKARTGTRHLHAAEDGEPTKDGMEMSPKALCGCSREEEEEVGGGGMMETKRRAESSYAAAGVSNDLGASVVHRARKSPYPMIPVSTALSLVLSSVAVMEPVDLLLSEINPGQVIARDVVAQENVPGYSASVMDGYAVIAADGPGSYIVRGSSTAGGGGGRGGAAANAVTEDNPLKPGQIMRITTGGPMPPGADAVVMVEDTELLLSSGHKAAEEGVDEEEEQQVRILDSGKVQPGQHVRAIGHDLAKGTTVLRAGEAITSVGGEIGSLAVSGNRTFSLFTVPKIAVMSTGDEVVDVSSPTSNAKVDLSPGALAYGAIRDCNRPALIAALRSLGCEIVDLGVVHDDPDLIAQTIRTALDQCQGIITTGGVSMGERDWLKPVVEQRLGGHIRFGRVAMKPSKPTTFATIPTAANKEKFIFALPGNPVSALVAFHMFVAPAIRLLSGHMMRDNGAASSRIVYDGRVTQEALCVLRPSVVAAFEGPHVVLDRVRPEYVRGSLVWNQRTCKWTVRMVDQKQQSSRVASMQRSNALISLPRGSDDKRTIESGELVTAIVIAAPHFS
ncbi:hypothetical protein LPJ59_000023 [Coemansia sp. RSA 2399]|nr:hypothetical protein LPJ59_000023 [Coemansia sp. RSA 2399]KAJ1908522.1 hypothetical protein LPJ81_000023 [Coemansia sp. IMI 209127]